ncbi:(Na+)-NQR maturation NqrM [Gynuella sp.]|uniref:(Na+)-NQR maturation NqrM n=1 Tax=Gynuella sp. TaxID=2969146 RepID=UPI003D0CA620
MSTFIVVFFAMVIFTALMAVGVMMGRKPITGSCGGMAALGMDVACDICGGDKSICEDEVEKAKRISQKSAGLAYDAAAK